MKTEKDKAIKTKSKVKKEKKKFNVKNYIRDFLLFVDKKLIKKIGILAVISLVLIALSIKPMVSSLALLEESELNGNKMSLMSDYSSRLQVLLVTLVAGIVPYIYAGVVGFIGSIMAETSNLAYLIFEFGYLKGIGAAIVPLIINIVIICIITALAIYMCKTITIGYKISNVKNMNSTNFRIKLYEVLNKQDKVKALTKKKTDKIAELESKKEKLNYIQILNVSIIVCILQLISVVIQHILT